MPRIVVLGNPGSRRVELFCDAVSCAGLANPLIVSWLDWINGRNLTDTLSAGHVLRIESPGKVFEVERAILIAGESCGDSESFANASRSQLQSLEFDKGRILWPRQWYLGFSALLQRLKRELAHAPPHIAMNDPDDIALMFDKPACRAALLGQVPQPKSLDIPTSYDDLISQMSQARMNRVFIKLAHGSSASGVIAYQTNGRMHRAITTVETVNDSQGVRLYNTRRLRTLTSRSDIADLVNALCPHRLQVERWIPKAGLHGKIFDLRVVVIGGKVCHTLARLSNSPVTNLHLLNDRSDTTRIQSQMGQEAWARAMSSCEKVMTHFPRSLYAGIDLLIANDFKSHAILEVNAFGDQIPGTLYAGQETYDLELARCRDTGFRPVRETVPI